MKKVLAMMLVTMILLSSSFAFAEDVYAKKNGKKYHKMDCLMIQNKGAKALSMEEATAKGLKPCRKCYGDATSKIGATDPNTLVTPEPQAAAK